MATEESVLTHLMNVIESRKGAASDTSYTASLFAGGVAKIGAKITEEAGETVQAAHEPGEEGRAHLVHEAADLVYHLCVLLAHRDVGLDDLEAELVRRFGVSGHDERASRSR